MNPLPWAEVPADAAALLRPGVPETVEDMIATLADELISATFPLSGELESIARQGVELAISQFLDMCGHEVDVPDLRVYRVLGRQQARAGQSLDAVQSAYRIGARVAWRHLVDNGQAVGLEPGVLFALGEAIFVYIERLSAASVAGFAEEQSAQEGAAQARRQSFVELLVRPRRASVGELEEAAEQAGWSLHADAVALVFGTGDPVVLARRGPEGTIGAALDGLGVLLVPWGPGAAARLDAALSSTTAVIGPVTDGADVRRSLERARVAWPLQHAAVLGPGRVVSSDEHLLALALAGAPGIAEDLVQRRLGALLALGEGPRERSLQTVRAWLDAHGDVSAAAEHLHVHPQTVRYRLGVARETLGDVLDDPVGRLELALALRARDQLAAIAKAATRPTDFV